MNFRSVADALLRVAATTAACAAAVFPASAVAVETGSGLRLGEFATLELPVEVASASDVRWSSDGELLLGVGGQGVYSWRVGEERARLRSSLAGTRLLRPSGVADYSRVGGASLDGLVFADFLSSVYRQHDTGIERLQPLEMVGDIDRVGDSTVAIGLLRKLDGGWEDYGAWLIKDADAQARGLLPTRDEGRGLSWCMPAELPVVRFVEPDRILVVPGAESGVFLYSRDGFLEESLEASTFFADDGCGIKPEQRYLLADHGYRAAWLSRRRVIDEAVADADGNVFLGLF